MILEYSIKDPFNIKMFKKYSLVYPNKDTFIGLREIAVNRNYIVHLLIEPETRQQIIRVYSRSASNIE